MWKFKKIPKIIFFYWFGKMPRLNYKSIKSFIVLNPDWKVIIYIPKKFGNLKITWNTGENTEFYQGKDYFDKLKKFNITVIPIDFKKIGFKNNCNELFKCDYIRFYHLSKFGGVYCDADVLFTKSMDDLFIDETQNIGDADTIISYYDNYYSNGLLMSAKNNKLFKFITKIAPRNFDNTKYQTLGVLLYKKYFPEPKDMLLRFPDLKIYNFENHWIYPITWCQSPLLFENTGEYCKYNHTHHEVKTQDQLYELLKNKSKWIGIHWINGCSITKKYILSNEKNDFIEKILI